MTYNMEYYALCRVTDPTYTKTEALRDYLRYNPDVVCNMVYDLGINDESQPITYDMLQEYLNSINSVDAFRQGMNSWNTCDFNSNWFQITPHGVESMSQKQYKEWCFDAVMGYANEIVYEHIIPIPQELCDILELWNMERADVYRKYPILREWLDVTPSSKQAASKPSKSIRQKAKKPAPKKPVQKSSNKRTTAGASKKPAAKPRRFGTATGRTKR